MRDVDSGVTVKYQKSAHEVLNYTSNSAVLVTETWDGIVIEGCGLSAVIMNPVNITFYVGQSSAKNIVKVQVAEAGVSTTLKPSSKDSNGMTTLWDLIPFPLFTAQLKTLSLEHLPPVRPTSDHGSDLNLYYNKSRSALHSVK